jgi:hypothetical protein
MRKIMRKNLAGAGNCSYICLGWSFVASRIETNTRKVVDRLKSDGWTNMGGGRHDRFLNPGRPETMIIVPRHRELSPGVARSIAKAAGWI